MKALHRGGGGLPPVPSRLREAALILRLDSLLYTQDGPENQILKGLFQAYPAAGHEGTDSGGLLEEAGEGWLGKVPQRG